ncbi:F-box/kelch-repeat protein At3g61590-like [Syzygium oleosum]|uniref:F-box/kelch-repeat protein At3g61590-like n=1 Tax=Syzygium oleosum TaxID=219896 RepID=UPI0024BBA359|nr:F-box/kelch-repeat protein At3g61590-like [Syzygium oleosum]
MAGVSLKCGDCGALLKSVEEAQGHAELTSHSNFFKSTEAVLNLVCSSCGKPCRSKTIYTLSGFLMEGETLSADQNLPRDNKTPRVSSVLRERERERNAKVSLVPMDWFLPDDLSEQILACLPFADLVRAGAVCTRWRGIITSRSFRKKLLHGVSRRPWLLGPHGHAYDPVYNVWYELDLPRFKLFSACIAKVVSSTGLISALGKGKDGFARLYVYNPLTRRRREIARSLRVEDVICTPLAITVSRTTPSYRVSIVTTKDLPGVPVGRELSIRLYSSQPRMWVTCMTEVLIGWRSGYESVICDGVLYFSIYQTGYVSPWHGDGLVMYDLSGRCSNDLLASFVPVPCPLPRGCLMNMKEKLVLVGDISEDDRASFMSMKGVGIWVLNGREWHEIARMPDDLFLGFGSDPWIRSSGLNDLIYILSERGPYVVTFDMNQKQWSRNSLDKVPTDVCDCCCFEPWLEIAP